MFMLILVTAPDGHLGLSTDDSMNVFGQIRSQWSLNETISYLCKLLIQDGRQGPLLKIAQTHK